MVALVFLSFRHFYVHQQCINATAYLGYFFFNGFGAGFLTGLDLLLQGIGFTPKCF